MSQVRSLLETGYLGRLMIFGRDRADEHNVVVYAITGRSPSSRARTLSIDEHQTIRTEVADTTQLQRGNPKLLLYNCIRRLHAHIIVSNGAHTDLIFDTIRDHYARHQVGVPVQMLMTALSVPHWVDGNEAGSHIDLTTYEPDFPNWTARIGGIMSPESAAMVLIKQTHTQVARSYFEIPFVAGRGRMLSTYAGPNVSPPEALPAFFGEPLEVHIHGDDPKSVAQEMYNALGPRDALTPEDVDANDFRVGVAVLFIHRQSLSIRSHIINRLEQTKIPL